MKLACLFARLCSAQPCPCSPGRRSLFTGDDVLYVRSADTGPDTGLARSHWLSDCSSGEFACAGSIGMIINTSGDGDRIAGNQALAQGEFYALTSANQQRPQAAILSHLNLFNRLLGEKFASGGLPTDTYDGDDLKLYVNGEAVMLEHPPSAQSDSDTVVFFRRSDVISTGEIFDMRTYPVIDAQNGGSIDGILRTLNHLSLDIAVPGENEEGGTLLIPGYGHVADRNDLANYRDMLTIIRDRIQDLVKKGKTLDQVKAARPTYDYDGGYGADQGPWTTGMFIEAVYREMSRKGK